MISKKRDFENAILKKILLVKVHLISLNVVCILEKECIVLVFVESSRRNSNSGVHLVIQ